MSGRSPSRKATSSRKSRHRSSSRLERPASSGGSASAAPGSPTGPRSGAIDIYPEYTGTLARIILKDRRFKPPRRSARASGHRGLTISEPLGFNNTYALAVRVDTAERLGLKSIGDLVRHQELTAAFSSGFLEREDGWPGLRRHYGCRWLADGRWSTPWRTGRSPAAWTSWTSSRLTGSSSAATSDPPGRSGLLPGLLGGAPGPRTWPSASRARGRGCVSASRDARRGAMAQLNAKVDLDGRTSPRPRPSLGRHRRARRPGRAS